MSAPNEQTEAGPRDVWIALFAAMFGQTLFLVAAILVGPLVLFTAQRTYPPPSDADEHPAIVSMQETTTTIAPRGRQRAPANCPIHPWSVSVVVKPDGTISYYERDSNQSIVEAMFRDASSVSYASCIDNH